MSSTSGFVLKSETPLVETVTGVIPTTTTTTTGGYPLTTEFYPYKTTTTSVGCGIGCTTTTMPTTTSTTTTTVVEGGMTGPVLTGGMPYNTYKYVVDLVNVAEDAYLTGHQIDGRILYPTTGYLYLVWKSLAKLNGFTSVEQMPITFENVEIHRATILALKQQMPGKQIEFCVRIVPKSGLFELVEGENVIVTGRVAVHESIVKLEQLKMLVQQHLTHLNERRRLVDLLEQEEIYRELRMRGYEYNGEFMPLLRADLEGTCGELLWTGKWIPFLDAMLQLNTLSQQRRITSSGFLWPTRIRMIKIDPFAHMHVQKMLTKMVAKSMTFPNVVRSPIFERPYVLPVVFDPITSRLVCGGVEIHGINTVCTGIQNNWYPVSPVSPITPTTMIGGSGLVNNFVPYVEKHFDEEYVVVDKCGGVEGVVEPVSTLYRQNREFLEFYLNECKRYVSHILRKIEEPSIVLPSILPTIVPKTIVEQLETLKIVPVSGELTTTTMTPYGKLLESGKLLELLVKVANIETTDGQFLYKIQKIFGEKFAYLRALEEDCILNLINNRSYYLKSILDTVLENTHHIYSMSTPTTVMRGGVVPETTSTYLPKLRVLEISPSVGHFFGAKVSNLMRLYPTRHIGQIEYHYVPSMIGVHPTTLVPEEYICELNKKLPYEIKKVEWNFGLKSGQLITEVPSHLREYDLVIMNGGLSSMLPYVESEYELKKWLQTVLMEKVLKPQGFLFVHEYTNSFEFLSMLNKLEHCVSWTPMMTTGTGMPMMTPYKFTTGRFPYSKYMGESQWRQLIEECGFYPVSMKSDVELSSMFLYRRPVGWTSVPTMPTTTSIVEEKIFIDEYLETPVELIKRVRVLLIEKPTIERLWLMSEREPTVELVSIINSLRREMYGEKIRCLFVGDRQPVSIYGERYMVPTTPIVELVRLPFVQTPWKELFGILRKADLVMNVLRYGQWGSFRPIVNVRGLYPITPSTYTTSSPYMHYPFLTGSTYPVPPLNSTCFTRFPFMPTTVYGGYPVIMTHLPVGYPFEYEKYPYEKYPYEKYPYEKYPYEKYPYEKYPLFEKTFYPTTNVVETGVPTTTTTMTTTVLPTIPTLPYGGIENTTGCIGTTGTGTGEYYPYPLTTVKSVVYRTNRSSFVMNSTIVPKTTTSTTISSTAGISTPTMMVPTTTTTTTMPTIMFNPLQTYIITCGLGSFGLELVEWIIEHGARRVIITSKYGVRTGYQARKLRILRDEFGAEIKVLPVDVREEVECLALIKEALLMCGGFEKKIGGIFHLGSCIEDVLFEREYPTTQVHEVLRKITELRCQGAFNLDKLTRTEGIMDECGYFVVFSPVLTTPTMPTVLEKICESRRRIGRHGLALHWGCSVESGLLVEKMFAYDIAEPTSFYTLPERIFTCLNILKEVLLKSFEPTTWSHYIPVEKYWLPETTVPTGITTGMTTGVQYPYPYPYTTSGVVPTYKSIVELLLTVLGVKEVSRLTGCESMITLGELGLDTVLAGELKLLFEQIYNFPLSIRDIHTLTLEKLRLIESRYPQGIWELYQPRPLTWLPRLRSVIIPKTLF